MTVHSAAGKPARLGWVDTGRGIAIVLVVLFHAANWLESAGFHVDAWITANLVLANIRMPMFFTLSGLFAGKWANASWRDLWSVKLSLFVWVYGLWSVLATFSFMAGLNLQGAYGNYFAQFKGTIQLLWAPRFELWFIWALALMFVLIRLMRRWPVWAQLVPFGVCSAFFLSPVVDVSIGWQGLLRYTFFFLMGIHLRERYFKIADQTPRGIGFVIIGVSSALAIVGTIYALNTSIIGYYFVTCCAGSIAGILISRELARFSLLQYLGKNTLPVYLTHTTVIILICWLLHLVPPSIKASVLFSLTPPLLAAVAIWLALLASTWADGRGFWRYLYVQPPWFAVLHRERRGAENVVSGDGAGRNGDVATAADYDRLIGTDVSVSATEEDDPPR